MKKLILIFFLIGPISPAQQRYLVTPNDEVIPLKRGESPAQIIARKTGKSIGNQSEACNNVFTFGYPEDKYPANSNFGAYHKDVMGEWFVMKASGTIDSLFWETLGSVGALDSLVFIRVHNSRIGPNYGPGTYNDSSNWPPPCQNWGYFINTNDDDQGVGAFPEDAAPQGESTWVSTNPSGYPTKPPTLQSRWGFSGFAAYVRAGAINGVSIFEGGSPLNVTAGDQLFFSMRVNGPHGHTQDARTEWSASGYHVDNQDEAYPSRDWKFYEHDSGPSNCAGMPTTAVKSGWVARGGFGPDTLDVAVFNWWYTMTVNTNVPPDVQTTSVVHTTFSTGPQTIDAEILDCDPEKPFRAGVKRSRLKWMLNGNSQSDIEMVSVGGITWEADIPGMPDGSVIQYKVYAEDSTGQFSYGTPITYRIVSYYNIFAIVDTSGPCVTKSIAENSGNVISPEKFFLPPNANPEATPLDGGTAGPFDMGRDMQLFGDVGRYMWIGIDGGIAISKSATDTVDVNARGIWAAWTFPSELNRRGGRSDSALGLGSLRMPGNFFAPLWTNLWHGDSIVVCGHIRFQRGFTSDSCLVIVEWDSVGAIAFSGGPACDELTFRAIFNTCEGTIEYQYDNLGTIGVDSTAIVGFQADSSALTVPNPLMNNQQAYALINELGYPRATRPRPGFCLKILRMPVTAIDPSKNIKPGVYTIGQNYPNPFNPTTTFNVDIPKTSNVRVVVYDVVGREISVLLSGEQSAGSIQLHWDGKDAHGLAVPTGIYFVKMDSDGIILTRKLVLLK